MAKLNVSDIKLARDVVALGKGSPAIKDFDIRVKALEASYIGEHLTKVTQLMMTGYQELLSAAGGNSDLLAQLLYCHLMQNAKNSRPQHAPPVKTTGRPPNRWGPDGVAKLVVYFCAEEVMEEMRAEGIPRPKIKDAVARLLGIKTQRERSSCAATINDHASRYSEMKKILKTFE